MRVPGFISGSGQSQSLIADGERTVNFYLHPINSEGAASKAALYPVPGTQQFIVAGQITDISTRAILYMNGRAFTVVGTGFYELFATGLATRRGTVAQDSNLAQIVSNGAGGQLLIASGTNAYCYVLATNVLTQVLTGEATQIGMLDGFFLAFNIANGKLRISNLNDGTTWDPTQFALRSAQPDPWQAMLVNAPDIWLVGEQTSDVWFDSGASPFPLQPRQGLTIPFGIVAPFSLGVVAGAVIWLSRNKDGAGIVVQARGYFPQKISTDALDTAIAGYQRTSIITDAEQLIYQKAGHTFYNLRFPSVPATWTLDLTTNIWHERGKWNSASERYEVWTPRVCAYAFGQHLVGDATTGTIATMDETFGTEADGTPIRRMRRGTVIVNENQRIPIDNFELLFEAGVGLATGQGSDPKWMFRGSADGGKTWGNERQMGMGKIGEYQKRAYVVRLGSPRLFVPEVTVTDPVPARIIDAFINNRYGSQAA